MKYKLIYPGQFVVWITAMLASYENIILAEMVKKGYMVSIVSSSGKISDSETSKNFPSVLMSFRVDSLKEDISPPEIHKDILSILSRNKFLYYSVIVTTLSESCFIGSNINLIPPISSPISNPNKPNLN